MIIILLLQSPFQARDKLVLTKFLMTYNFKKSILNSQSAISDRRKGQLLIETLIALSILTTGFLGILSLLSRSLSLNRVVSEQYQANYLAAEGIEIVKHVVDQNVEKNQAFNSGLNDGCYEVVYNRIDGSNFKYDDLGINCPPSDFITNSDYAIYSHPGEGGFYDYYSLDGVITPFRRYVEITNKPSEIDVDSYVVWISRGGGQFEVHLTDAFYDWRPKSGI